MRLCVLLLGLLSVTACSEANHLGNPLTLPLRGLVVAAENGVYNARRAQVSAHLQAHMSAFQAGVAPGDPVAASLWNIAGTPPARQGQVLREFRDVPAGDWVEQATVIVMVLS